MYETSTEIFFKKDENKLFSVARMRNIHSLDILFSL